MLDDLETVVEAVNRGIHAFGFGPIDVESYRRHYTRPVKTFYERLFARTVTDDEWRELDRRFQAEYRRLAAGVMLRRDARWALDELRRRGVTQSLLSMSPHRELTARVEDAGIAGYFLKIEGVRGRPGGTKADHLPAHLRAVVGDGDPSDVLVVGDSLDDAHAASRAGARCVLLADGSHLPEDLAAAGVPVAYSLREAVGFA